MPPIEFVKLIKANDYDCNKVEGNTCLECPFRGIKCGFSHRWSPLDFARRMWLVDKFLEMEI